MRIGQKAHVQRSLLSGAGKGVGRRCLPDEVDARPGGGVVGPPNETAGRIRTARAPYAGLHEVRAPPDEISMGGESKCGTGSCGGRRGRRPANRRGPNRGHRDRRRSCRRSQRCRSYRRRSCRRGNQRRRSYRRRSGCRRRHRRGGGGRRGAAHHHRDGGNGRRLRHCRNWPIGARGACGGWRVGGSAASPAWTRRGVAHPRSNVTGAVR